MTNFLLQAFAVLATIYPQVLAVPSYGGFVPTYPAFQAGVYEEKPLMLTCAVNFTNYYKRDSGIVNAIAVTIKEKSSSLGTKSSLLSYTGYGSGLSAVIEVYSVAGGPVSIAFTERAKPEDGCSPHDFGSFLTPKSALADVGAGAYADYGTYGIGNYGAYGTYGIGNYGAYGTYGIGNYGAYSGYGIGNYGGYDNYGGYGKGGLGAYGGAYGGIYGSAADVSAPGVIAKVKISPGTTASVNIDNLDGFTSLKELAGRGVVICPQKAVKNGYKGGECEGGILSCCALHYDCKEQGLGANYNGY